MHAFDPSHFAAYIGIDWADAKHDVCLQVAGSESLSLSVLKHSPQAIDEWAQGLQARFPQCRFAVCLELAKGPLVFALAKYDCFVLFPVNPQTLAGYRKAFYPSGAKDDPVDAELQLEFLLRHGDTLSALEPQGPTVRKLEQLVASRRLLIDETTRITNRLTATLKNHYPQVLQWFTDKDTRLFCDFLGQWPTLASVQRARRNTLVRFFHAHHVRRDHLIEQRIASIRSAMPLTTDPAVIEPHTLLGQALVRQLQTTLQSIKDFDQAIADLAPTHDDYHLFRSFPGAGPVFAPRLLVAFGEQRQRHPEVKRYLCMTGIAPVTERSGKKSWVHWRLQCPKFLRQTFVEWAPQTLRHSFWAKAYYDLMRSRGKSHQVAIRALAFKWIRILHRCWLDRMPYDESRYLMALRKKNSPLLQFMAEN